jgi:hypothetical protein
LSSAASLAYEGKRELGKLGLINLQRIPESRVSFSFVLLLRVCIHDYHDTFFASKNLQSTFI